MSFTVPLDDEAADAVLAAFRRARDAGLGSVECYRAGVQAWRKRHPDQTPEYAAKRAVAIILAHSVSLGVFDGPPRGGRRRRLVSSAR